MTAIIIPTWNNSKCLQITLESLLGLTKDADYRVIVVDNGSGSKTRDYLSTKEVEVVRLNTNEGFVGGTNAGLARVKDGEDVCFLNDDVCVVDPQWLSKLSSKLIGDVGACGPISNYVMGCQSMQHGYKLPMCHEAPFLVGFCMLVRADVFKQVGLLDKSFGMGGCDDLDYCIRIRKAGFRMMVNRNVFLFHWGSITINKLGGAAALESKNQLILRKKWGEPTIASTIGLRVERL